MATDQSTIVKNDKVELMSPAGSFESLQAAIQGGADSVYFGIEQLNMRSRAANNFSLDDLRIIKKRCDKNKVKTYLTLNTVIYDHDVSLMRTIVDCAKANKINAIIASDQAVLSYCRKAEMPVHISTQANVSNIQSIDFYSPYADAIVLARELSLSQVTNISKQIKRQLIKGPSGNLIKIEVFAHGALCMAVSGKCYLSLHSHNASANRGACIQNCRRAYIVIDKDEGTELEINNEYIMSAKDLCTIDFLDKLINSGTNILKIEGRARSAEYVYVTTKCYREAIDSCYNGDYTQDKINNWKKELSKVFNRGFWGGYYLGKKLGEWADSAGSEASQKNQYLAKAVKYYSNKAIGEFKLETGQLAIGNTIMIAGPTTGIIYSQIKELRVNDMRVDAVKKGEVFTLPVSQKIHPSDKLYKIIPV